MNRCPLQAKILELLGSGPLTREEILLSFEDKIAANLAVNALLILKDAQLTTDYKLCTKKKR